MRELLLTRHLAGRAHSGRATRGPADFRVRVSSLGGHRDWQWQARTSSRELRVRVSASGGPQRPVPMSESPPPRRLRSPPCADRRRSSIKSRASPDRAYTRLRATVCESHSNTASPTCDRHTHDSKQAERIARDYCAAHAQRPLVWRGWSHGMGPYTVTNPGRCGAALQCRGLRRRQHTRRILVMILKGRTLRREAMVQPLRRPGGAKTH